MIGKENMVETTDYMFVAETCQFFPVSHKAAYVESGTWPKVGKVVSGSLYASLMSRVDLTHKIMADTNGLPTLGEICIDYTEMAEEERANRMKFISNKIDFIVAAISDEDATEQELELLPKLRELRSKLRRMDLSKYPEVEWPDI